MRSFIPKQYQQSVLESIEKYFRKCRELGKASTAYTEATEELWGLGQKYSPLKGFESDMPYFCLRVPTGGGKTWLAAKAIQSINTLLLNVEHSVILWLVPSEQILKQTLEGLKDGEHPLYHAAREAGHISVFSLDEAKYASRASLETSTAIIVATRQAFQVKDENKRKVYDSNGSLMPHFEHLTALQRENLLKSDDGQTTPYSLANMLRLYRPFIIVDEAHNSRTELACETLAKFRPSGIMELTATPDTTKNPSNVLHSVSAFELKAEEMIKLPIWLYTEPNWQQCLADAIARRAELQAIADIERRQGAEYLRPLILIQAQAKNEDGTSLDVHVIYEELKNNQNILEEEMIIATGEEKGLDEINKKYTLGLFDPACPVKYIITQKALAEGWDCPFAYILASVAPLKSSNAVEQLLGRVLRQPQALKRVHKELNESYAFVAAQSFRETAEALREKLVNNAGFERKEVQEFFPQIIPEQGTLPTAQLITSKEVTIILPEATIIENIPENVKEKISYCPNKHSITINKPLENAEIITLQNITADNFVKSEILRANEASKKQIEFIQYPAELGYVIYAPQFVFNGQGSLEVFTDVEDLDFEWDISANDAIPSEETILALNTAKQSFEAGMLDIDNKGNIIEKFINDLSRDLGIIYKPENWDMVKLAAWLCNKVIELSLVHDSKYAFITAYLNALEEKHNFSLSTLNQHKFILMAQLEKHLHELKRKVKSNIYQISLFEPKSRVVKVDKNYAKIFASNTAYAPNKTYDGIYGKYQFQKHFFRLIGDFDSKEEYECACEIDKLATQGKIKYWVRNLVRKEYCSFSLPRANGQFYPDFICVLPNNTIFAIEYKGADKWDTPDVIEARNIGELWAELSNGQCKFLMLKNREWARIEEKLV